MAKHEKKTPKEASDIFHNIMKASVSPKKANKVEKEKPEPKPKK